MKVRALLISLISVLLIAGCSQQNARPSFEVVVYEGLAKEVSRYLSEGVAPDSTDSNGNPMIVVSMGPYGSCEVTRLLLEKGAAIDARIPGGDTALMNAAMWSHLDCVRFLLQEGADPRLSASDGKTALELVGNDGPGGDSTTPRTFWQSPRLEV